MQGDRELYRTVQRCAVSAACEDPRFPHVEEEELPSLSIEISVLTPVRRLQDPRLLEVGKHGLMISQRGKRGVLLPQVATEHEWDRETFLAQTCRKAGLPPSAWREPACLIEVFSAEVFSEE
jgi:AmmeMemoRadiSam system protein A